MSRRIIQTGITKEMLSGDNQPQLQIGDKLYVVDDRKSTYDKMTKIQEDSTLDENEKTNKIFELTLGKDAAKEIADYDLSFKDYINLTYCIMGAITGEDPEELKKRAQNSKN